MEIGFYFEKLMMIHNAQLVLEKRLTLTLDIFIYFLNIFEILHIYIYIFFHLL